MSAAAASFLGDSTTDIQAAYAAGAMSTGYTNKPGKPRNSSLQVQTQ
jgi:phosphoglycolate phosphatase-like HAD superfamily hydrolase